MSKLEELQKALEEEQKNFMDIASKLMSMEDLDEYQKERISLRVKLSQSKEKIISLVNQIKEENKE